MSLSSLVSCSERGFGPFWECEVGDGPKRWCVHPEGTRVMVQFNLAKSCPTVLIECGTWTRDCVFKRGERGAERGGLSSIQGPPSASEMGHARCDRGAHTCRSSASFQTCFRFRRSISSSHFVDRPPLRTCVRADASQPSL